MRISAIIVNYGRAADTIACVESLRADAPHVRAIVVDNPSPAGDDDRLERGLPEDAVLLRSDTNLGYAGGNNLGIRRALRDDPQAVLIVNNDVILEPGCVDALTAALDRHPDWGVAAPLSLLARDPGIVDFYTAEVDVPHIALRARGRDESVTNVPPGDAASDYVTGSAMLLRRSALEKTGFFDERFFLVWEDVDLCLRLARDGFQCGVTTNARVLHARSASFGGDASPLHRYFFARNSFLVVRKHLKGPARYEAEAFGARRYARWGMGTKLLHRAIRRGLRDGLLGRWGPAPSFLLPPATK
ncbi:MAG: glycosyltransferase family 2 protein [Actinomycetota bacterium]|nr:glycosyltransferase family 2 protein [Actinomycetota bacterium]